MFSQTRRIAAVGHRSGIVTRLVSALSLHRQRRALSKLDAGQLADLGLTESPARAEAARAAWDVPPSWRL